MNDAVTTVPFEVVIFKKKSGLWDDQWRFTAHCTTCNRSLYGARTGEWANKASATKVATEHLKTHQFGLTYEQRMVSEYGYEVAGRVTA